MPYILEKDRLELDALLEPLAGKIRSEGELNYVISMLLKRSVSRWGKTYKTLNTLMGVMECCKAEFYRRVVASYEDAKITENGDVY